MVLQLEDRLLVILRSFQPSAAVEFVCSDETRCDGCNAAAPPGSACSQSELPHAESHWGLTSGPEDATRFSLRRRVAKLSGQTQLSPPGSLPVQPLMRMSAAHRTLPVILCVQLLSPPLSRPIHGTSTCGEDQHVGSTATPGSVEHPPGRAGETDEL
jgi:hypothetical protein